MKIKGKAYALRSIVVVVLVLLPWLPVAGHIVQPVAAVITMPECRSELRLFAILNFHATKSGAGTYTLDPGATITYVDPTDTEPVTERDSESLSGFFTIVHQPSSPFFGWEYFSVTAMELQTASGKMFSLASVPPNADPILLSTGEPASYLLNSTVSGTIFPAILLAGSGIAPEPGFQGFSIEQTGLMGVDGRFEGPATDPTGFDFTVSQPFTSPGVGLYEYRIVCRTQEQIQLLIGDVEGLVAAGTLNQGQGNSLIVKLQGAIQQLDQGNVGAAINQLRAFINEVNALVKAKKLSSADGQALIDAADEIIAALGG